MGRAGPSAISECNQPTWDAWCPEPPAFGGAKERAKHTRQQERPRPCTGPGGGAIALSGPEGGPARSMPVQAARECLAAVLPTRRQTRAAGERARAGNAPGVVAGCAGGRPSMLYTSGGASQHVCHVPARPAKRGGGGARVERCSGRPIAAAAPQHMSGAPAAGIGQWRCRASLGQFACTPVTRAGSGRHLPGPCTLGAPYYLALCR